MTHQCFYGPERCTMMFIERALVGGNIKRGAYDIAMISSFLKMDKFHTRNELQDLIDFFDSVKVKMLDGAALRECSEQEVSLDFHDDIIFYRGVEIAFREASRVDQFGVTRSGGRFGIMKMPKYSPTILHSKWRAHLQQIKAFCRDRPIQDEFTKSIQTKFSTEELEKEARNNHFVEGVHDYIMIQIYYVECAFYNWLLNEANKYKGHWINKEISKIPWLEFDPRDVDKA